MEQMEQVEGLNVHEWRSIAHRLWNLLDDIDTAGDQHKPTQEEGYFRAVDASARERHDHLKSDGHSITPPHMFDGDDYRSPEVEIFVTSMGIQSEFENLIKRMTHMRGDWRGAMSRQIALCISDVEGADARWSKHVSNMGKIKSDLETRKLSESTT